MRFLKTGNTKTIKFTLPSTLKKVAVTQLQVDNDLPFSDLDGSAVTGPETFGLQQCESRDEWISLFNQKSKILHLRLHGDKFKISDISRKLRAAPEGFYKDANGLLFNLIKQQDAQYRFQDSPNYGWANSGSNLLFRGGFKRSFDGTVALLGTTTNEAMLQSRSLLLQSDVTFNTNRLRDDSSRGELCSHFRSYQLNDVCTLEMNGRVVYPTMSFGDVLEIETVGLNNGIFVRSPIVGFLATKNVGIQEDIFAISTCAFSLRAYQVYGNHNMEVINPFPIDTIKLLLSIQLDTRPLFTCLRKDGTKVDVLRGPYVAGGRFFMADVDGVFPKFKLPKLVRTSINASRSGSLVLSITTASPADYTIITGPRIDLSVVANLLLCNGIATNLSIASNTTYVISVDKGTNLKVTTQTGSGVRNVFEVNTPSYTYTQNIDSVVTLKGGLEVGPFAYGSGHDEMYQLIQSELNAADNYRNLGALSVVTFANLSSSYAGNRLTVDGVNYTRVPYRVSQQVADILRIDEREIVGSSQSIRKTYLNRLKGVNIYLSGGYCRGYNDTPLAASVSSDFKILNPVFHSYQGKSLNASYTILDAQNNQENALILPSPWSVTLQGLP